MIRSWLFGHFAPDADDFGEQYRKRRERDLTMRAFNDRLIGLALIVAAILLAAAIFG